MIRRVAIRLFLAALVPAGCAHAPTPREKTAATTAVRAPSDPIGGRLERAAGNPLPTVVSTDSLAALVGEGAVAILDVRTDIGAYLASHLPGAVYLSSETLRAEDGGTPNLLLPRESYATLFSRLGVRADRPVAIYASGEARNIDATYVAWILSGLGHPDVRVLDGGFAKWDLEARTTTRRYPSYPHARPLPGAFRPERATLADVRASLGREDVVLVDARSPDQYAGEAGAQIRRGHIPGAVNHFWQNDLVEAEFARSWRPVEEIRASYRAQGITPDKRIITYCNGGLESSHVWFTLRVLLGYPDVRVYDGSWTEWSAKDELPIETGPGVPAVAGPARR